MLELPAARKPLNSPEEVDPLNLSLDSGDIVDQFSSLRVIFIAHDPLPRFSSIGTPALKRRSFHIYTSGDINNIKYKGHKCNTMIKQGMVEAEGAKDLQSSAFHELPKAY